MGTSGLMRFWIKLVVGVIFVSDLNVLDNLVASEAVKRVWRLDLPLIVSKL